MPSVLRQRHTEYMLWVPVWEDWQVVDCRPAGVLVVEAALDVECY